nr:tetratricopeptide repeat protein [Sandaracinobacteroides sayramensis]
MWTKERLPALALGALLAHATAADAHAGRPLEDGAAPEASVAEALAEGRTLLAAGDALRALQAYNRALAQAPESVEALNGAAVCYDRLGNFETSRTFYEMALGLDPRSPMLLNNYGYSLYLQGERGEAARFLALAVATGDSDVQATALRILGKIDADRGATVDSAHSMDRASAAQTAYPAPTAGSARLLRTSAHEVRLLLGGAPAGGAVANAILPVVALSAEEERLIAEAEAAAIRREAVAATIHAQRQAQLLASAQTAAVPAMMQAMLDLALGARPVEGGLAANAADFFAAPRPPLPAAGDPEWNLNQILQGGATPEADIRRTATPAGLVGTGLLPPRPDFGAAESPALPADEPLGRKRSFAQPFASDDARLNNFAQRLQHGEAPADVDEQVARLQALIARAGAA